MALGEGICTICNKPLYPGNSTGGHCVCKDPNGGMINITVPPLQPQGWVCPVCGRGNSPTNNICPCQPYPFPYPNTPKNTPPVIYGKNDSTTGGKVNG